MYIDYFFYYYTNICTNKRCKINIKITPICLGVNTLSSGGLEVVSAKVMSYKSDKMQYSSVLLGKNIGKCGGRCNS